MSDDGGNYLYRFMRDQNDGAQVHRGSLEMGLILDLGHDVRAMFILDDRDPEHGHPGSRIGLRYSHKMPDGPECCGSILFDVPEAEGLTGTRWDLLSMDPLHVEPSVLCRRCNHHGFIRSGAWVPA